MTEPKEPKMPNARIPNDLMEKLLAEPVGSTETGAGAKATTPKPVPNTLTPKQLIAMVEDAMGAARDVGRGAERSFLGGHYKAASKGLTEAAANIVVAAGILNVLAEKTSDSPAGILAVPDTAQTAFESELARLLGMKAGLSTHDKRPDPDAIGFLAGQEAKVVTAQGLPLEPVVDRDGYAYWGPTTEGLGERVISGDRGLIPDHCRIASADKGEGDGQYCDGIHNPDADSAYLPWEVE